MDQDDDERNASTENQNSDPKTSDPFATVDSQQSSLGQVLGGYRLLGQLGKGGMGVVYEAESLEGGEKVALKTLQAGSLETLARLKSEFRVLTDLAHPNLVRLGELNTTAIQPFFTMEIIRGVAFDQYVTASLQSAAAVPFMPFNEKRLRKSLVQLAKGLESLHSAGLVHRDIKPSNVMVRQDGRVVILDMGLAMATKAADQSMNAEIIAGTPYYMAPEQMRGEDITPASDWYAVGVILFEVLTGEKLFHQRSLKGILSEKLTLNNLRARDVLASVPHDLSHLCERLLNQEPSQRPDGGEILELLSGTVLARAESGVWIGRERELLQLADAWSKVQQGIPQVVLVTGPSGMGKTSLVDRFLSELRNRQPIAVLRGRCYENEAVPYRGIDSIVDSLGTHLQHLPKSEVERVLPIDIDVLCQVFPVLKSVSAIARQLRPLANYAGDAKDLGQRGIAALRELLCRLARFESVVLFIDDLQQGDEDTASVFRELFRVDQAPRLLFLGTFRSEDAETSVCLRRVRKKLLSGTEQALLVDQVEIAIHQLPDSEALSLAHALLTTATGNLPSIAARIARESGGDPLFIRMLAEDRNQEGEQQTATADHPDNYGAPFQDFAGAWNLSAVIEKRVRALGKEERRAIEILATAGRPIRAEDLEAVARDEREGGSVGLIRSLRIQKLVKRLGDRERIELYHDKIKETALSIVPSSRQAKYCLRLADFLESGQRQLDVEFLADLCRRGGDLARSGTYYQQAARIAEAAFAFNRAIECYQYALQYLEPGDQQEATLRQGLGDALANASRSPEAATQYLLAAKLVSPEKKARLQQLAALRYLTSGHVEKGVATLKLVLEHHGLPWPDNVLAAIFGFLTRTAKLRISSLRIAKTRLVNDQEQQALDACWAAAAGLSLVDPLRGSYYISETLLRSLKTGSSETLPRDLAAYMGQAAIAGSQSRRETCRILKASRQIGAKHRSDPYMVAMPLLSRGIAALLRGEWTNSLKCCDRAIEYLTTPGCFGKTWELSTARTFALWSLQYQGNLKELARRQPELLISAIEADDLFATLNYGTQVMTHLMLAADQPEEALRRLNEDRKRLSESNFYVQHHNYVLASTYTYLYMQDYANALSAIEGQWKRYRQSFLSQIQQVRIDHHQVYARALLAAAGQGIDRAKNLKRAKQVIRSLRAEKVGWADALVTAFDAIVDALHEKDHAAYQKLDAAKQRFEKVSMQLFAAAVQQQLITGRQDNAHEYQKTAQRNAVVDTEIWKPFGVVNGARIAQMLLPLQAIL